MKKKIICLACALLLCLSCCACGQDRTDGRDNSGRTDLLPETSPMVSPDWNDGVVRDQDGVIGNGDGGTAISTPGSGTAPGQSSPTPGQNGSAAGD